MTSIGQMKHEKLQKKKTILLWSFLLSIALFDLRLVRGL